MGWMANLVDRTPATREPDPPAPRAPGKAARQVAAIDADRIRMPAITARQIRTARALLGIGQEEAAALAGIARPVYTRIETGKVRGRADTLDKIEAAFRAAGVELIYSDASQGEGARMARPDT